MKAKKAAPRSKAGLGDKTIKTISTLKDAYVAEAKKDLGKVNDKYEQVKGQVLNFTDKVLDKLHTEKTADTKQVKKVTKVVAKKVTKAKTAVKAVAKKTVAKAKTTATAAAKKAPAAAKTAKSSVAAKAKPAASTAKAKPKTAKA